MISYPKRIIEICGLCYLHSWLHNPESHKDFDPFVQHLNLRLRFQKSEANNAQQSPSNKSRLRLRRIMRIAVIVALIWVIAGAIWWALSSSLKRFGSGGLLSSRGQIASAQTKNIATVTGTISPAKSARDPAWEKLLEYFAVMMRGKKIEVSALP